MATKGEHEQQQRDENKVGVCSANEEVNQLWTHSTCSRPVSCAATPLLCSTFLSRTFFAGGSGFAGTSPSQPHLLLACKITYVLLYFGQLCETCTRSCLTLPPVICHTCQRSVACQLLHPTTPI
jgi:hypothetical protein